MLVLGPKEPPLHPRLHPGAEEGPGPKAECISEHCCFLPSAILQSDLCSLTHSKKYGHVVIPLSGDMTYRVG